MKSTTQRTVLWLCATVALLSPAVAPAQVFTYLPPGDLIPGSGTGRVDYNVYFPDMRFPIELVPAYANSQVYGVGGSRGPAGSECDPVNYSYPWRDDFCETRSWTTPMCPTGTGHQGQDIRASTCVDGVYWTVAAERGTIVSISKYSYSVHLQGDSGFRHKYLHMKNGSVVVRVGDRVESGDRIGLISDTDSSGGHSTFYHLHYEMLSGGINFPPYMSLVAAYKKLVVNPEEGSRPCSSGVCDSFGVVDGGGQWWLWDALSADASIDKFYFGNPGDVAFMGDWDGDGVATPGLYRQSDGKVYLRNSNTQGVADVTFFFGNPGDIPLAGDFDGDGWDTVSIYRPSEARVYVINELGSDGGGLGPADFAFYFGNPGDSPFVGDFDGDGIDTVGLHRESTGLVYLRNSLTDGAADLSFYYGNPGDVILAGDWDGDGDDTVAAYRPSTGRVYVNLENSAGVADYSLHVGSFPTAVTWGRD